MTVDDRRRTNAFARNSKQHGRDVAGGGGDGVGPQEKSECRRRVHVVNKRQHERQRGGSTKTGKNADRKTNGHPNHHVEERFRAVWRKIREDVYEPLVKGVQVFQHKVS